MSLKKFAGLAVILFCGLMVLAPTRRTESFGDHIGNYNFRLEIDGVDAGQFKGVDGLSIETEVVEYQDGSDIILRKRPGRVKYGNLTLKRGYIDNSVAKQWYQKFHDGDQKLRSTMTVTLIGDSDKKPVPIRTWNLYGCWPKSWKVSSFDGKGNDVLTEEMVIVIEWFEEA